MELQRLVTAPALDTLDDEELLRLYQEIGRILRERGERELPAVVLEAIREVLTENGDTREPVQAAFATTKWDNGYFWAAGGAQVTYADGSTGSVDIDDTDADEALSDHAVYQSGSLDSGDTLTVVFQPPTVQMS
ncbi:hypothetical protein [Streptomyces lydicus]|uniref:hypothetical protein n=1 Tax=Streptomyces lydicus TaxID=47763 RepID=UPI0036E4CC51